MYILKFFGGFEAAGVTAEPVQLRSRKARALLLLLVMRQSGASRDFLASTLWPENEEKSAKQNLRQSLSEIRAAFGAKAILSSNDVVKLNRGLFLSDVEDFDARANSTDEKLLREVANIYRGPFGAELSLTEEEFDGWLSMQQRHFRERAVAAFDRLIELLNKREQFHESLAYANLLLAIDPLRESTHRQVLRLESLLHGRSRALSRFDELRRLLRSELDIEPEPETLALVKEMRSAGGEDVSASLPNARSLDAEACQSIAAKPFVIRKRSAVIAAGFAFCAAAIAAFGYGHMQAQEDRRILSTILPAEVEREPLDRQSHSIVVLPFTATPAEAPLQRVSAGLLAKITAALASSPPLTVISIQTAITYQEKVYSVTQVANELDVKYAVIGSVQREGERNFVYPKLLDAGTGIELWAGRFELNRESGELIADEISIAIGRRIERAVERLKLQRAPEDPPEAMALVRQGNALMQTTLCSRLDPKAGHLLTEALRINPESVRARVFLSLYLINEMNSVRLTNFDESLKRAEELSLRALELAPEDAGAYFSLGHVRRMQGRNDESLAAFERALQLQPNNASTFVQIGYAKMMRGDFAETEPLIRRAFRLNPRGPFNCIWASIAGMANFYLERDEEAIAWFKRAIELGPDVPRNHQFLAAIYALRGDRKKAAEHVEIMMKMSPPTTLRHIRSFPGTTQDPRFQKQRARFIHGAELAFGFANRLEHRTD